LSWTALRGKEHAGVRGCMGNGSRCEVKDSSRNPFAVLPRADVSSVSVPGLNVKERSNLQIYPDPPSPRSLLDLIVCFQSNRGPLSALILSRGKKLRLRPSRHKEH
jgi:hypothetical protein